VISVAKKIKEEYFWYGEIAANPALLLLGLVVGVFLCGSF
jgi:hypothetical protein